jgi:hypothetical protein
MRTSEWIVGAFFTWTSILAVLLPISGQMRTRVLLANAVVLLIYMLLALLHRYDWSHYVRDCIPQGLIILAYKQMGWFAPHTHTYRFEHSWIVWDRILLNIGTAGRSSNRSAPSCRRCWSSLMFWCTPCHL